MTGLSTTTAPATRSDLRAAAQGFIRAALARLRRLAGGKPARAVSAHPVPSATDAATRLHLRMCGAGGRLRD